MNNKPQIKIEYEGQNYQIEAKVIEGLEDEQILSLLSPSFPGMAGAKINRKEDGSLEIIKRVGTKGSKLVELLKNCPKDTFPQQIVRLNQKLSNHQLTLGELEQVYQHMNKVISLTENRRKTTRTIIQKLNYCQTNSTVSLW